MFRRRYTPQNTIIYTCPNVSYTTLIIGSPGNEGIFQVCILFTLVNPGCASMPAAFIHIIQGWITDTRAVVAHEYSSIYVTVNTIGT